MEKHIRSNVTSWLRKFFTALLPEEKRSAAAKRDIFRKVNLLLENEETVVEHGINIDLSKLMFRPTRLIPALYRVQHVLEQLQAKSFCPIPLCSANARHITITNTGLAELLHRCIPEIKKKAIAETPREYWVKYFEIEKFESAEGETSGKKFHSLLTNGISASLRMTRPRKTALAGGQLPNLNFFDNRISIDPGKFSN